MVCYKIIRFDINKGQSVIKKGLSLEEAQAHCRREDTHKKDANGNVVWFDGYSED